MLGRGNLGAMLRVLEKDVWMLREHYPYYLANRAVAANRDLPVIDKYTGKVATVVALAGEAVIDQAIAAAVAAAEPMRRMKAYERQAVLMHCVKRFTERADELAESLCVEAGKPIKDAEGEVTRLIDTFRIAAEESVRMTGELQPLDISPRARLHRHVEARADRAVLVYFAVQLPAQPGRAQDSAGARRRLPLRAQAGEPHADRGAYHR